MGYLPEGKSCMWLSEEDPSWNDIDVPLSKVGAEEDEQMDNVGETKGYTREHDQQTTYELIKVVDVA